MAELVNVDNFRFAETARMFDESLRLTGGVNQWFHYRNAPTVENQPVIRMNRDTLYSGAIVDISQGAEVTLPDSGDRYMTVMVVNGEHYLNQVFSDAGTFPLSVDDHETPYVSLSIRTFVDPSDPNDVAEANRLQDATVIEARSSRPYVQPDYDRASLDATRSALLKLADGVSDSDRTFGRRLDVEPTRHLIGTAYGWGGLPEHEAYYYMETEPNPEGQYTLTLRDVPVDEFWSVTVYNRDGYLEPNPYDSFSLNSVTAEREADGSVVLNLAPEPSGLRNHLYVMDGWNYGLRLYRPRPEVVEKTWLPPKPVRVD